MLWQKESKKSNALYVDISKMNEDLMEDEEYFLKAMAVTSNDESLPKKNDAVSLQKRQQGNALFTNRKWVEAIEKYNEGLCYAKPGSQTVSLAYANRSAVFFHLKQFDRCLKDIELAKKSGYPADLRQKLDKRKADCLKLIDEGAQCVDTTVGLSYDANRTFPCLANVLQIEKDANGKCKVIAKEDIDVGKTILLEKSFLSCLFNRFGSKCSICLRAHVNLVPCKKCTIAMFCSTECQGNPLHKYECGVKLCDNELMSRIAMKDLRVLLLAINIFRSADDLMKFVEETRKSGTDDLPLTLVDDRSKYRAFLKQKTCVDCIKPEDLPFSILPIYQGAMKIPDVKSKFHSIKHRRFLMHLVAHHSLMGCHGACCNAVVSEDNAPVGGSEIDQYERINNAQVGLVAKYFTHSKSANMLTVRGNGKQAGIVIRPIKKGEEVLNSCAPFPLDLTKLPSNSLDSVVERLVIEGHPDFKYILKNFEKKTIDHQKMIDSCLSVLQKFDKYAMCDQLILAINAYGRSIRSRLES